MFFGRIMVIGTAAAATAALVLSPTLSVARATALPSLALDRVSLLDTFTPSGVDKRLAGRFAESEVRVRSGFRFTPAGVDRGSNRAMTIVVRSQAPVTAEAMAVRAAIQSASAGRSMELTPTSYNLGAAKGLQSFTLPQRKSVTATPMVESLGHGRGFSLDGIAAKPSRFNPRVAVEKQALPSAPPRTLGQTGDYSYDVGGSYSLSRSLAVTAGVRYRNGDERSPVLTDSRQDNQAVYVGTLIRF